MLEPAASQGAGVRSSSCTQTPDTGILLLVPIDNFKKNFSGSAFPTLGFCDEDLVCEAS